MKLVGLVSSYKEGRLISMAIRSALEACDHVIVFEGPAGEHLDDSLSDGLEGWDEPTSFPFTLRRGEWASDAVKRTAMVKATRGYGEGPVWGVWVDGDEVLLQGEFLRDQLQAVGWRDDAERDAARARGERWQPTAGFPIRIVEMDGSLAVCRAKVVRVDLIDQYIVSSSGIRFKNGNTSFDHAEGNLPQKISEWYTPQRVRAIREDRMMLEPPLPGEPYLLHRSSLRHPARAKVRMHEQEARELDRLGLLKTA